MRLGFCFLVSKAHEDGDAGRDHEDDEVFVRCEFAAVEDDVHNHDGDQFT